MTNIVPISLNLKYRRERVENGLGVIWWLGTQGPRTYFPNIPSGMANFKAPPQKKNQLAILGTRFDYYRLHQ